MICTCFALLRPCFPQCFAILGLSRSLVNESICNSFTGLLQLITASYTVPFGHEMNFSALQSNLRRILQLRIQRGEITGARLAGVTGYRQPHISNFINGKRGLSLVAMDRLLTSLDLTIADLLDPWELGAIMTIPETSPDAFLDVPVVRGLAALSLPRFTSRQVLEVRKLSRSWVNTLRPDLVENADPKANRGNWLRFVMLAVDARQGMAMYPRLLPGAHVLVDRHYNSLRPYRAGEDNLYVVSKGRQRLLRYVRLTGNTLMLRPENRAYGVEQISMTKASDAEAHLLGRVCLVEMEV